MPSRLFPARGFPAPAPKATNGNGTHHAPAAPVVQQKAAWLWNNPELFWDFTGSASARERPVSRGLRALTGLVYACVRYRWTKLIEPPLWLREETPDGEEWLAPDADHPLRAVLERPNPDMTMGALLQHTSVYLDTIPGGVVWVKNRDRGTRVASLYPFAGDEFSVEEADGRMYGRFRVRDSRGRERVYGPDDVVYFLDFGGVAPLDTALDHVEIGEQTRRAVKAHMRRAIRPGATITFPGTLEDAERERFRAELVASYGGAQNAGKPFVLEGGATFQPQDPDLATLTLGDVNGDVEIAICSAFQVHPAVVAARIGVENSGSWSDIIQSATALYYDVCQLPRWALFEETLTAQLLREADPDTTRYVRFDTTRVRALQADMGARTTEAQRMVGQWTRNEIRIHTGQAPLDDERGEEIESPAPSPFGGGDPFEQRARRATPATKDERVHITITGMRDPKVQREILAAFEAATGASQQKRRATAAESRRVTWAIMDALARTFESTMQVAAERLLAADAEHLAGLATGTTKADPIGPLSPDEAHRIEERAEAYLTGDALTQWRETVRPLVEMAARGAASRAAASVGIDFSLLQPGLLRFVEKEVGFLITSVTDTTREAVRLAIRDGLEAGDGAAQMAKRIRESSGFNRERATLIARTESTRATNGAAQESLTTYAADTGLRVVKQWITAGDGKVRAEHAAIEGETRELSERFSNGRMHPDEPNCRCTVVHEVMV